MFMPVYTHKPFVIVKQTKQHKDPWIGNLRIVACPNVIGGLYVGEWEADTVREPQRGMGLFTIKGRRIFENGDVLKVHGDDWVAQGRQMSWCDA